MRFSENLDKRAEDIVRPPVLPAGTYLAQVKEVPAIDDFTARSGILYDRVNFQLVVVEPVDVDEDEVAEFGTVAGETLRHTFMFNTAEDADGQRAYARTENNLKRFLGHLGIENFKGLSEALGNTPGEQCLVEVRHRADPEDAEVVYAEVGRTMVADA